MTNTTDIIATGGFNTGRLYRAEGQRIFWAQRADGWLFFNDIDRMISGWVKREGALWESGRPPVPAWVLAQYDAGNYEFYAPNQNERNPSVPDDFDFGAKLNI
jgi:hypothetical protein